MRPRTCPLAAARASTAWVEEITDAFRVMHETHGGMNFVQITGREPHRWDVRAIAVSQRVRLEVLHSDDAIARREKSEKDAREGKG